MPDETKKPVKKENSFKPVRRVIIPAIVRFDIPVPDDCPKDKQVDYGRERAAKIVEALNKKKGGVRATIEFPPPPGHFK